jgi:N-acetylglucosamine-6-phosphate deacetylase
MPCEIIRAARAFTPTEEILDAALMVEDGVITSIGRREEMVAPAGAKELNFPEHTMAPGFVDVHIHGAGARDVMEATPDALKVVTETVARHGTTTLLATTVSAPLDATCKSLQGIAKYIQSAENRSPAARAEIVGVHLEGPFLSHARRGVHPPESLIAPTRQAFSQLLDAAEGLVRILTIAPELPGALEVIGAASGPGVTVALGHTDATFAEAHNGIEHGARHGVHVFNAMRPFSHRETGVLGAVLTDPRVTAELIADGVHVDDPAIQLLLAAKGTDATILVSDGTAATGMPDGTYKLGPFEFTVAGGVCRNSEGKLAGSTLTLDRAIRHMTSLKVRLREAIQMATLNPARRAGIAGKKGVLATGADADLVLLTQKMEIAAVFTRGVLLA